MPKILLVYDKSELDAAELLESELDQAFKEKGTTVDVIRSPNEENARERLPGEFSLVITPLNIRKTPQAQLSQEEEAGLELLLWMNQNGMNKPSILITPTYTKRLRSAHTELQDCYVVLSGANMVEEVVEHALQMADKAPSRYLQVDIDVRSRTQWNYRLNGKGFPFETEHEVPIDEDTVKRLSTASVAIGSPTPPRELEGYPAGDRH
jgi:hypothetical protein